MKLNFSKFIATAVTALAFISSNFAQTNIGTSCGCPPLASRALDSLNNPAYSDLNASDTTWNVKVNNLILTCDKKWILTNKTYVGKGKTITIQPGTVVFGRPTNPGFVNGGSLIISRGAKIIAAGTESCPIVFTSTLDPMDGTYGIANKAKWGGLILLGTATNNLTAAANYSPTGVLGYNCTINDGIGFIEGFSKIDSRIYYGANAADPDPAFQAFDDNDNSGVLTYVSSRHGGEIVGDGNEINGITFGSVGRGTTVHHCEVVSNLDDGFEFFGGTVDIKYCSVFANDDDGFDWDQGYRGRAQFLCVIKTDQATAPGGDNGFEGDSDDNKSGSSYLAKPTFYNCTYIGSNNINGNGTQKGIGIQGKEATGGILRNNIIANYKVGANFAKDPTRTGSNDAYDYWQSGEYKVECNTFIGNTTLATKQNAALGSVDSTKFVTDGNLSVSSIGGFDFIHTMNVNTNAVSKVCDLIPSTNLATTCTAAPVDGFFTPANYRGAFEAGKKSWLSNYTISALLDIQDNLIPCPTDLNSDGTTNTVDFLQLLGAFGSSCD